MLKEEKLLKRFLKRKFKITEAVVVGFLITGTLVYSEDIYNKDTISTELRVTDEIVNLKNDGWIENSDVAVRVIDSKNVVIKNNGKIKSKRSTAITLDRTTEDVDIQNKGLIEARVYGVEAYMNTDENVSINLLNEGIINSIEKGRALSIISTKEAELDINLKNIGKMAEGIGVSSQKVNFKMENQGTMSFGKTKYIDLYLRDSSSVVHLENEGSMLADNIIFAANLKNISTFINKGVIAYGSHFGNSISKENQGLEVVLDSNKEVEKVIISPTTSEHIVIGKNYDESNKITNNFDLARDNYIIVNDGVNFDKKIINGVGKITGSLDIKGETEVNESIVNSLYTAVYLDDDSIVTVKNSVINGGGLTGESSIIKGSEGDNKLSLLGVTTVNGDINLGSGNDMLTVSNESLLNGSVFGGAGDDTLALGVRTLEKEKDGLNIFAGIDGFETIKTNGKVTLFESAKVTGARDITLESGELLLRVDPTQRDIFDKITGHALYENSGVLSSTGGDLVIGLNGLGEDSLISMGDTTIAPSVDGKWWEVDDHLKTNSLVLDAKLTDDGDVAITVKELIPLEPPNVVDPEDPDGDGNGDDGAGDKEEEKDDGLFKKLNDIYASIVGAGEIGKLANTTLLDDKTEAEALEGLLVLLDQMYVNTPYAYTLKASKDSMNLFKDNLSYLTIKPEEGKWITQGRAVYSEVNSESGTTLNGSYGFNSSHRDYETNSTISGGLASFEYGLSSTSSYGFALGGNNQKVKFRGSNSIDGSSVYLGTFLKKDVNNFKFKTGLAYQYSDMSVDRGISNGYDSFVNGANYDVNAGQFFLEGKYVIDIGDNTTIEPRMELVVTHVEQESISEKYGAGKLSMGVDKIGQTTTDVEMGVDFVKSVGISGGKINNILRLGIVTPMGIDEKPLAGHIVGAKKSGNKFEIRGIDTPSITGNVGYTFELEKDNGMLYNAGIDYKFVDKDRNFDLKLGVGYKF